MPKTNTVDIIMNALDELAVLRPFPGVATRLLQVSPTDLDARELASVIECDPAISLQLLRVANSAVYGFSGQIRSVSHAVVVLGFREVRTLALSLASGSIFGGGGQEHGVGLWNHSLGCAAVARSLANHFPGSSGDEAFLGGILHDVGKLVFFDAIPDDYAPAIRNVGPLNIAAFEMDEFGITHQEVGQQCADTWGLPIELNDVIAFHHVFDAEAAVDSDLLKVVRNANCLARWWGLGSDESEEPDTIAGDFLDLSDEELEQIRESATADYSALRSICAA